MEEPSSPEAVISDSGTTGSPPEEARPQAGPLPSKRGEIGYQEGVHDASQSNDGAETTALPGRHPADQAGSSTNVSSSQTSTTNGDSSSSSRAAPEEGTLPRSPSPAPSSVRSTSKRFIALLKPRSNPTVFGIHATTLLTFILDLGLLGATLAGWVIIIKRMQAMSTSSTGNSAFGASSAQIFVHVAFAITVLAEIIFIERCIFRIRAERYCYLHPGAVLPTSRQHAEATIGMGIAPWHRPPLPTYAAALAQSGLGTGDVEDNVIAIPPPPAYGNTRGSTLLLAGFISNTLRAQRSQTRSSATSVNSSNEQRRETQSQSVPEDRPMSYMSVDPDWEERCDADRAMRLEETLARLEDGGATAETVQQSRR
ncbi:hypothetical protein CERSUDRAFT_112299 [Gelatoporia subvermispora B]|uniref:Uncharacterized protein n=1 Tax=Ceriporiopsis subvermispora (strain B) TaxID=914234 RepID=M2RML2_CERS8|nr:hypothetical protein CERSUDRAFT_112299 [Gelatoporia subvermispora B]